MNDLENAIEYFTKDMKSYQCLVDNKLFPIELAEIYRNHNKAAIQALKKQIPKEVNYFIDDDTFETTCCGTDVTNTDYTYCPNCGCLLGEVVEVKE